MIELCDFFGEILWKIQHFANAPKPRREEEQFFQMLFTIALQSLTPPLQVFFPVCQRSRDLPRLISRPFQDAKCYPQAGRRFLQFGFQLRQRRLVVNELFQHSHRVAKTSENLRGKNFFIDQFPQSSAEHE